LTDKRGQLVFLDTPGLHKSEGNLGTLMNRMARSASAGVDILMIVFDGSRKPHLEDDGWMHRAAKSEQKVIFVLNKSDKSHLYREEFRELWHKIKEENESSAEVEWIETSAVNKGGSDNLVAYLYSLAQVTDEYLFSEDIVTDYPRKLAIADVIREKFIMKLHDELPHELGIFIDEITEMPSHWNISAVVYVNRPSQKGIVIGPGGQLLKMVRQKAEPELSDIFETKVTLDLWVKVEKNWFKNVRLLEQMGYAGKY
jgi:GTP-binding protein Era